MQLSLPGTPGWQPGPTTRSFWVVQGRFGAGAYPGAGGDVKGSRDRWPPTLEALHGAGFDLFVNLTEDHPGGTDAHLNRYDHYLAGRQALVVRFPIPDVSVPDDPEVIVDCLDTIDHGLASGRQIYVHCWGGIGRTGTVVGCWLVRHDQAQADTVLDLLAQLRQGDRGAGGRPSPETPAQRELVRSWSVGR